MFPLYSGLVTGPEQSSLSLENLVFGAGYCKPTSSEVTSAWGQWPQAEGPRHLHRIPRLTEAPWEAP